MQIAAAGACLLIGLARVHSAPSKPLPQLAQPVTIAWQDVPLAAALARIAQTQSVAIWLDRRVDSSQTVSLSVVDRPLSETLAELGAQTGMSAVPFENLIYCGPRQAALELATLAAVAREPLAKAPADARSRWLRREPWSFPRLSEPRKLFADLTATVGAEVARDSQPIPHDLWPERNLPALAAIDRAVLILSGFDLTCRLSADGRRASIAPIARPVAVRESYRVPASQSDAFDALLAELPHAVVEGEGSRRTIAARVEDHERLRAAVAGRSAAAAVAERSTPARRGSSPAADSRRFTLTIENKPLAAVLNQLSAQLGLQIEWDAAIPDSSAGRSALVSCQVEQADLDALLQALLDPAEMTFERHDNRVTIRLK